MPRSYLDRDAPASSAVAAGRVRVCDSTLDPSAVRVLVEGYMPHARVDDVADAVQSALVQAWLSGRGLEEDPARAASRLAWWASRRLRSGRPSLWARRTVPYDEVCADVLPRGGWQGAPEWEEPQLATCGSPDQVEARADADEVIDAAVVLDATRRAPRNGQRTSLRVTLGVLSGLLTTQEAAAAHGGTHQGWSLAARTLAAKLRERLDG